ncbi:ubiquinone biosynthesis O-methyltransferase [Azorhizobium oxalatiphilum]|uniref:Ubiquinone biosynthesis O-methyltransferase n=1 Tax=Azorhizobium oxalatiphilum TaxID=980631 RepID=A0A917F3C0_9HYPH|nr:bifunctional 2-polyprenyl-6-hydroxyphenol methylase/3-demethylubiquinol 3-O-methyltransferase UbiG [Azorhizobium oxalatiphilum]GGF44914.1 ubiquinone biosynthesis O-methyltransferase [Azorhizobium oxalatiphilum]
MTANATIDPTEVARFDALGEAWWDPKGKMAPLHAINPVRLGFVRDVLVRHFGHDARSLRPLKGLRILDIGCGGGLLSEPLARMGAEVVGVDPAPQNIAIASAHAAEAGVVVDYRQGTAEELADAGEQFDVVLALEVVEHVADVGLFLRRAGEMVSPNGVMIVSTLNRTAKSFALAIVGAEYVLRWLPRGTHSWDKFITPEELEAVLAAAGFSVSELAGMVYNPLGGEWRIAADTDVNYFSVATPSA